MALEFKRATRAQVPLKLGISGPSGAGKTTAALRLTRGLVGPDAPIAFLDTENGSASLYSDITEFDVLNMTPPYLVQKFIDSISTAVSLGYKALVIDSASHEWSQILQDKEALDSRGGNNWTNWASFTKKHEEFLAAIRNAPIHLVLCLRSKEIHEMNDQKKIVKMGQGAQMRTGFAYELTSVFDIAMDHTARTEKDRTGLFDGRIWPITESTGRELAEWLTSGKALKANADEAFVNPAVAYDNQVLDTALAALKEKTPNSGTVPAVVLDAVLATMEPLPTPTPDPETDPKGYQKSAGEMFRAEQVRVLAEKTAPSTATDDFVDGMADGPAVLWCSNDECSEIRDLAVKAGVDVEQLARYMAKPKNGWMPDTKNWTRIKKDALKPMKTNLGAAKVTAFKSHLAANHAA